jgi:hypothetical protein
MPRAVAMPVRLALWAAAKQGASTTQLACRFALPQRTVRRLLAQTRANGDRPTPPAYRCGPRLRSVDPVRDAAVILREEHPSWGARFIRGVLADSLPEEVLPCERTLRRWLRGRNCAPAPAGRESARLPRAARPHQRWQIDAADQMRLSDDSDFSWLKAMDECTGAALGTVLFPPRAVQPGAGTPGAASLA